MEKKENRRPLIIIAGPTAVGKSAVAVRLAAQLNASVISADSMQVYKYMDIGSAKVTPEEMQGIDHYLVDALLPSEDFHVARFQAMAKDALEEIYAGGKIPIVAGGTGFYIQALLYDIDFAKEDCGGELRRELEEYARTHGAHALHERLKDIDRASYESIHENNVKRVIRALEFYEQTGTPISAHNETERAKQSPYNFAYFVLTDERAHLYECIDRRVDNMLAQGLVDEVRRLKAMGCHRQMVAMQGLGYKELLDYMDGLCTFDEAVYRIKRETRHFAKRQLTWFRRERGVIWLDRAAYRYDNEAILKKMLSVIAERGIIPQ